MMQALRSLAVSQAYGAEQQLGRPSLDKFMPCHVKSTNDHEPQFYAI